MTRILIYYFLGGFLALALFQNCGKKESSEGTAKTSSIQRNSNGNGYEGKLVISVPTTMAPGASGLASIQGGQPPYTLSSDSRDLQISQVDANNFQISLGSQHNASQIQLMASDSLGEKSYAQIMVLGVNNWYFKKLTSIAPLANGAIALIHKGGSELVILSREGQYSLIQSLFETEDMGEVTSVFSPLNNDLLYMADSQNGMLLIFDSITKNIQRIKIPQENCGNVSSLISISENQFVFVCENKNFVRFFNSSTLESRDIYPSQSDFKDISDIQKIEGGLFVTSSKGEFIKMDLQGQVWSSLSIQGFSAEHIDSLMFTTSHLNPDGSFYYLGSMARHIYHFDNQGHRIKVFVGRGAHLGQASTIEDFGVTSDGQVVVSDSGFNRLSFYSKDGKFSHLFGVNSAIEGAFSSPSRLAYNENNELYILDRGNSRIQVFGDNGKKLQTITSNKLGRDAYGLSLSQQKIIVTRRDSHQTLVLNHQGDLIQSLGNNQESFNHPSESVLLEDGRFIVADSSNHQIQIIKDGQIIQKFGEYGFGGSQYMIRPSDIEVNYITREIYVLNRGANTIHVFDFSLNVIRFFPSGRELGLVKQPLDMSIGPKGRLYIIDRFKNRFVVLDKDGNFVKEVGPSLSDAQKFDTPTAIDVSPNGKIAVADTGNHRILIFPPID